MNCYVTNYHDGVELPPDLNKDNTLFFPEQGMTTHDLLNSGRPRDFHIVTDSPFLIPLYSCDDVFVWHQEDKEWRRPSFQTYGCSYDRVIRGIFNGNCMPQAVLDGSTTNVMGCKIKPD